MLGPIGESWYTILPVRSEKFVHSFSLRCFKMSLPAPAFLISTAGPSLRTTLIIQRLTNYIWVRKKKRKRIWFLHAIFPSIASNLYGSKCFQFKICWFSGLDCTHSSFRIPSSYSLTAKGKGQNWLLADNGLTFSTHSFLVVGASRFHCHRVDSIPVDPEVTLLMVASLHHCFTFSQSAGTCTL